MTPSSTRRRRSAAKSSWTWRETSLTAGRRTSASGRRRWHRESRDNIAYGNPDASEEEIPAATRATYVDRFVRSLPDGYDTVIDEEGSNVSAGEKQLITIARAFLSNPDSPS